MQIRALREEEFEEHAELVYVSYSHGRELEPGSMLTRRRWWLEGIERDPYYEPAQTRVMEVGGRLVASVSCYHRPTYVTGRVVDAACIGSVCTHPEHRRKGYVRQVLAEAVEWMREQRWEWSFLYGLEDIYGGSGWRNLTAFDLVADLHLRDDFLGICTERQVDPEADAPTLARMYEQFNRRLTGPTVRTEESWRHYVLSARPGGRPPDYRVVVRDDREVGCYWMQETTVREAMWLGRPHELLAHVIERAGGEPVTFGFWLPEMAPALRDISRMPSQGECRDAPATVTLRESYRGLWRYHQIDDPVIEGVTDTEALVRMLHDADYVMWPADKA